MTQVSSYSLKSTSTETIAFIKSSKRREIPIVSTALKRIKVEKSSNTKARLEETKPSLQETVCSRCKIKALSSHTLPPITNIDSSKLSLEIRQQRSPSLRCTNEIPLTLTQEEVNQPRTTRSQSCKSTTAQKDTVENTTKTYTLRPSRARPLKPDLPIKKTSRTEHTEENIEKLKIKPVKAELFRPIPSERAKKLRKDIMRLMSDRGQIQSKHLSIGTELLGEGQTSLVYKAMHRGLEVACKTSRPQCLKESESKIKRELNFAAKLLTCRFVNKYVGSVHCHPSEVMAKDTLKRYTKSIDKPRNTLFIVQRYYSNGDGRTYFQTRKKSVHPFELLNVAICLFSALTDAHSLGVGFVDLKLENLLIDNTSSAYVTDFESCVEFHENEYINLTDEVSWTLSVAAPEMIKSSMFCKPSDVFMATVILAELMAATTSDQTFEKKILQRQANGLVSFATRLIPKQYKPFFPLLEAGLDNDPSVRPTAKSALNFLLSMKSC
ncbi:kinase-like domain-containing protein [Sporodiniella umbellata]|nr:kinase-like domain-containing protein [Sporodiniella umbellata]